MNQPNITDPTAPLSSEEGASGLRRAPGGYLPPTGRPGREVAAMLEKILQGTASPQLKNRALFVLDECALARALSHEEKADSQNYRGDSSN